MSGHIHDPVELSLLNKDDMYYLSESGECKTPELTNQFVQNLQTDKNGNMTKTCTYPYVFQQKFL